MAVRKINFFILLALIIPSITHAIFYEVQAVTQELPLGAKHVYIEFSVNGTVVETIGFGTNSPIKDVVALKALPAKVDNGVINARISKRYSLFCTNNAIKYLDVKTIICDSFNNILNSGVKYQLLNEGGINCYEAARRCVEAAGLLDKFPDNLNYKKATTKLVKAVKKVDRKKREAALSELKKGKVTDKTVDVVTDIIKGLF